MTMMARFGNKVVLVTGASGQIGGGIARQFLVEGAKVVTPVRSQKSAGSVVEHVAPAGADKLEILVSDIADDASAATLASSVKQNYGEISEQPLEEVQKQINTYAIPHFLLFKHFAPLLKDDDASSFTFISGAGGLLIDSGTVLQAMSVINAVPPWGSFIPKASLLTVGASALFGISITARGEYADKAPRVNECRLAAFVSRHEQAAAQGTFSNYAMGRVVADVAASGTRGEVVTIGEDDLKAAEISE